MKNAAATQALRDYGQARSADTRHRIQTAIRTMRKDKTPISINAVARRARVSRSTIYRHEDLLHTINALRANSPRHPPAEAPASSNNTLIDALRHQLRQLQVQHQQEISALRSSLKEQGEALATAHGEIHRLTALRKPHASS